jgi:ribosomal protein L40E
MILNAPQWSAACPLCEHVNPPDAKFCNACGTAIDLVPCPGCGAVNDPTATSCHQCAAALPQSAPGELARPVSGPDIPGAAESGARTPGGRPQPSAQPGTQLSLNVAGLDRDARILATLQELRRLIADTEAGATTFAGFPAFRIRPLIARRRPLAVIVAGAVLAVLVAVGYSAFRERPVLDVHKVPEARGVVKPIGSPTATGAPVSRSASEGSGVSGTPTSPLAVTPPVAADAQPAGRTTASAPQPGAEARDPSEAADSAPAAVARPRSTDADRGILDLQPPRIGPCTEGAAALGLCVPEAVQRRE